MKIYLGNIAYQSTESQLLELLTPFEPIFEFNYPKDSSRGRHRGFAFAIIPDRDSADEAIRTLDGFEFLGRPLRVKEAEESRERAPRGTPPGFRKSGESVFPQGGQRRRR